MKLFKKNILYLNKVFNMRFRFNLSIMLVIFMLIFFVTIFLLASLTISAINNIDKKSVESINNTITLFIVYSVSASIIIVLTYLWFRNLIYNPIKKIEIALQVIAKGDSEGEVIINKENELYSTANYINSMLTKQKKLAQKMYSAKVLKKQAELNALQAQINPHFLYNTLDSIRGVALAEGVNNIADMTKALSNLFRYSITKKNDLTTLAEEITHVEDYIMIQKFRFDDKIDYIKDINTIEHPDILDYYIPKLTLQPIVENAIFHGLELKKGKGTIKISAYTTKKRLVINIEDDGIGIKADLLSLLNDRILNEDNNKNMDDDAVANARTGIALQNVNKRIRLFFGTNYGLRIYSTFNIGTNVEIVVPLYKENIVFYKD